MFWVKRFLFASVIHTIGVVCIPICAQTSNSDNKEEVGTDSIHSQSDSYKLNELVITSSVVRREATKDVITITNEMRKGTTRAVELLSAVPGISINPISQQVNVDSHQNVPLFLDGRPMSTEYIKGINPKRIARVEIIRVPTGQYAGCETAVNIILKKDFEGWDIDAQAKGNISLQNKHSMNEVCIANTTLSSKKINIYVQGYQLNSHDYSSTSYQRIIHSEDYSTVATDAKNPNKRIENSTAQCFIGTDLKFATNQSLSAQFYYSSNKTTTESRYEFVDNRRELTVLQEYPQDIALNMMYYGRFATRWNAYAVAQYDRYTDRSKHSLSEMETEVFTKDIKGCKDFWNLHGIVSYMLSDKILFRLGNDFTYRRYRSVNTTLKQLVMTYSETRNNAEIDWIWLPSQKFQLILSGTLQSVTNSSTTESGRQEYTVNSFQPLISTVWGFAKDFNLRAQFNYVHGYPTLDMLTPAIYMEGHNFYKTGNTNLRYCTAKQITASISYKSLFNIRYFLSLQKNAIYYGYYPYEESSVIGTYVNCAKSSNNLSLSSRLNFGERTSAEITGSYSHTVVRSYQNGNLEIGNSFSVFGNVTHNLIPLSTFVFAEFDFAWKENPYLMGMLKSFNQQLSFGLRRAFFSNRVSLTLSYQIPVVIRTLNESIEKSENFFYKIQTNNKVNSSQLMLRTNIVIGNQKSRNMGNAFSIESEK